MINNILIIKRTDKSATPAADGRGSANTDSISRAKMLDVPIITAQTIRTAKMARLINTDTRDAIASGAARLDEVNSGKRLTDADTRAAIANGATTADELAKILNISKSNAFYRLRKLNGNGANLQHLRATQNGAAANVAALMNKADAAELADVADVVFANVNAADYTPATLAEYKTRSIDGVVNKWTEYGANVLLIGDAGSGKTTLAQQLAAIKRVPFLRVAMDDTATLRQFIGRPQARNGSTFFNGGVLLSLLQQPAIILFDEFNALPPSKLFFLHELLDGRRFFVADAGGGKIINVNKDVIILLACNPNNARYGGTNKMNAALIDRCAVVNVPRIDAADFADAFKCDTDKNTAALMKYYTAANELIKTNTLRVVFSLRGVKRIAAALRAGVCIADALAIGFYNCALLTAGDSERSALLELARVVFGVDAMDRPADKDGAKC